VRETVRVPLAWGLGACTVVEPKGPGTKFALRSTGFAVAEFLPDPGIDRYRVRAELRQDLKTKHPVPDLPGREAASPFARVGLVIGHARVDAGDGAVAHALLLVGFREPDAGEPADSMGVTDYAMLDEPLRPPVGSHHFGTEIPFPPAEGDEPPWRVLEVEVRPTGITVRHDGRSASRSVSDIHICMSDRVDAITRERTGKAALGLPKWHPRLPLGVWVSESQLSVRNVIIEPLP
jgi:hypothetical protein